MEQELKHCRKEEARHTHCDGSRNTAERTEGCGKVCALRSLDTALLAVEEIVASEVKVVRQLYYFVAYEVMRPGSLV